VYRLGDSSRLCEVSVKTLHHCDDARLVRPACVDRENGYRYYGADQVARARRIRNLNALRREGCAQPVSGAQSTPLP